MERLRHSGVAAATLLALLASGPPDVPPLVFVSRGAVAGDPRAIPGLGPHHRVAAVGGRLRVRERDGRVRDLLGGGRLFDVADPAVSFDATRVVFAGLERAGVRWRLWEVGLDGRGLRPLLADEADADDLDPCFVAPRIVCFASTRAGGRAEYADVPVTNLFLLDLDDPAGRPVRITAERGGAEEPAFDAKSGRVVFARWWFNRRRAAGAGTESWTLDPARAAAGDSVNLWQAVAIEADGADPRLAAGAFDSRRSASAYQPALLPGGDMVAVVGLNLGLSPGPVATALQRLPRGFRRAEHLAGAIVPDHGGDPYSGARGLAAPSAAAPAALPDGRVVFSYAPGGRDFGLWWIDPRRGTPRLVLDLPGTLELDPAPVVRRRASPRAAAAARRALARDALRGPLLAADPLATAHGTFRFLCLNVFSNAPVDHPAATAPAFAAGARIRFVAAVAPDSVRLVREAPVASDGSVDVSGLPAGVPLFEQVVDRAGRVLRSAHGAAHVAGFNAGVAGGTARCIGCHAGHSTRLFGGDPPAPEWFNAAPAARVTAAPVAPGFTASALVDRRAAGPLREVAWVAPGDEASARLEWPASIELRELVLRGIAPAGGARPAAARGEIRLLLEGREVGRFAVRGASPKGTRIAFPARRVDAAEIRIGGRDGRLDGRPAVGLAEVEAVGRLGPPSSGRATRGEPKHRSP